ncbi:MAG: long-chain fatty acid--CoA ligase [Candidatus Omnitrophica bacterium]|nr:long-chain fatty acid--CoA ligase [Candidatus Omnitrophota bacterium]
MSAAPMPQTIPALFFHQMRVYGQRTFCQVKRQGVYQSISWQALAQDVESLGRAFMEFGIKPRDRIALLSENRPEWAIADLAALSVGAVTVPIYTTLTPREIEHILADSGAKAVVVSNEKFTSAVLEVRERLPHLQQIVQINPRPLGVFPRGVQWYGELLGLGASNQENRPAFFERVSRVRPEDLASLIYTSGTTGPPKGVMLTHDNFLSNCRACAQVIPVTELDQTLSFLPLSHVFERMAGYYFIVYVGGTLAYAESLDSVPQNMQEVRPTVVCAVPRFYEKVHARIQESMRTGSALKRAIFHWAVGVGGAVSDAHARKKRLSPGLALQRIVADRLIFHKLRNRLGGRLRFFISGGAPLSKELAEFFYGAGILILEGYGLTETSPVITCNTPQRLKFGTVGRPVPGVEARIAEDGEVLTRGPHVMKGYFNNPEATQAVIDAQGWFHTGDIGVFDEEGFLSITDRKKDLIVLAGGKKVPPQMLEQMLKCDPLIADVIVIGDRRPYLTALIVPNEDNLARLAESLGLGSLKIQACVRQERILESYQKRLDALQKDFAPFERIKRFALLDRPWTQEAGELTPTMKVKRRVVALAQTALIETMYSSP